MSMKYYVVYSSGKMTEVSKKEYDVAFNDPYVTLCTAEYDGNLTIEKITEEDEHEEFRRPLGNRE